MCGGWGWGGRRREEGGKWPRLRIEAELCACAFAGRAVGDHLKGISGARGGCLLPLLLCVCVSVSGALPLPYDFSLCPPPVSLSLLCLFSISF
jgi:hypothetical protein